MVVIKLVVLNNLDLCSENILLQVWENATICKGISGKQESTGCCLVGKLTLLMIQNQFLVLFGTFNHLDRQLYSINFVYVSVQSHLEGNTTCMKAHTYLRSYVPSKNLPFSAIFPISFRQFH